MLNKLNRLADHFLPVEMKTEQSSLNMARVFVLLHLFGPAMGQSVIVFLWTASPHLQWPFWVLLANVSFFWLVPFLIKPTKSLTIPAAASVQALVFLSLFGSFFYGGISSPFLPWILIAMLLGFFYLADRTRQVLIGVAAQIAGFVLAYSMWGKFPYLLPLESLRYSNLISIIVAVTYMTMMSLYYENVMRASSQAESDAIAARIRNAELAEAMRRAEIASQQKSTFLAKMSHELRTPLNAVIGYSEMLAEEAENKPGAEHKAEDLNRINAAGRHLLALVTDVLDLSSIESKKSELSLANVHVSELVSDVISTARPLINKRDNELVVQMPVDPGVWQIDALKLRQSLLNLLSNAAKFTTKGKVTLSVLLRENDHGSRIVFEVRDTGIGIAEHSLERIFTEFAQAEDDTSQRYGGTGLGLALTRRFCHLMGGNITVDSTLGEGSSFTFEIPAIAPDIFVEKLPTAA